MLWSFIGCDLSMYADPRIYDVLLVSKTAINTTDFCTCSMTVTTIPRDTNSNFEPKNASPRASSLLPHRFLLVFVSTRCYGCTKIWKWSISWRDLLLQLWPKTFWSMYGSPKLDLCQILATIWRSFFLFSWTMAVWIRGMDGTEFLSLLEASTYHWHGSQTKLWPICIDHLLYCIIKASLIHIQLSLINGYVNYIRYKGSACIQLILLYDTLMIGNDNTCITHWNFIVTHFELNLVQHATYISNI